MYLIEIWFQNELINSVIHSYLLHSKDRKKSVKGEENKNKIQAQTGVYFIILKKLKIILSAYNNSIVYFYKSFF